MKHSSLFYAAIGALTLALGGCCPFGVDGNGKRVDETRAMAPFSRVRSDCELDVEVVQGDRQAVTVSIDSNLQDLVETRVADDTLYVDVKQNVDDFVAGPQVRVTLPRLTAAKLTGSGKLALTYDDPTQPLDLYLTGSGELRFDGTTAAIGAHLSGSGDLRLTGKTSDEELTLSGSGAIHARDMTATSASLDLSGSGSIAATVEDSVTVSLSGSGDIDLYGGAAIDGLHQTGSGDFTQH